MNPNTLIGNAEVEITTTSWMPKHIPTNYVVGTPTQKADRDPAAAGARAVDEHADALERLSE